MGKERTVSDINKLGKRAKFNHYVSLHCGHDQYSRMRLYELEQLAEECGLGFDVPDHLQGEAARVYRWVLRGLKPELAIRKVETEMDVALQVMGKIMERRRQK